MLDDLLTIILYVWGLWLVSFIWYAHRRCWLMPSFAPSVRLMTAKKKAQEAETCNLKHVGVYENGRRCDAATRKAADLLWSHLNNGQRNEVVREQAFTVYTSRGKFRFSLSMTTHYATPRGPWRHACIHTANYPHIPSPDRILALKLLAEVDPGKFLRIAVISAR